MENVKWSFLVSNAINSCSLSQNKPDDKCNVLKGHFTCQVH